MHLILALQFARVKTMSQISEAFYFKDLGMQIIDMFLKGQFLTRHFETKLFMHQNISILKPKKCFNYYLDVADVYNYVHFYTVINLNFEAK